ncbi:MAG TPA: D-aminoacyl-tRNA deacylase [Thermomicrobiales bacterium]|nr:D-aminoacyl-tRNA deacylase [Thermomicrobiales bacterium]
MRVLIQRVSRARVTVDGVETGAIGAGLLLFVGVAHDDTPQDAAFLAGKVAHARLFDDRSGKLNWSALDVAREAGTGDIEPAAMLVVSQFTLYGDLRRGRRPSFTRAAPPDHAAPMVDTFIAALRGYQLRVAEGVFGAEMHVELINDGPVTIWLDTADLRA